MTDKEKLDKLIAEIERRITFFKKQSVRKTTTDDNSCALALQGVLCFYDSMQEEPVSEDLEKAAINYMKTENPPIWGLHDGFIAGANWQKQQMMKDAYDAYVSYIRDNSEAVVFLNNTSITMPSHFPKRDLDEGDKLKVIAIKED